MDNSLPRLVIPAKHPVFIIYNIPTMNLPIIVVEVHWALNDKFNCAKREAIGPPIAFFNYVTMRELDIQFTYKTRYYTEGNLGTGTKKIWVVLHGYGQLARYFLKKFNVLSESGVYVIAPEGISKFYLEDVSSRSRTGNNRVGATWMTRENRLTEIENYISYLNSVYKKEVPENFQGEITILGFSQGAATAARWAIDGNQPFQRLILWAGIFPPDMNFEKAQEIFQGKRVIEVFGTTDPYLTDDRLKEVSSVNNHLNIHPEIIEFDGGHEIDAQVLASLLK